MIMFGRGGRSLDWVVAKGWIGRVGSGRRFKYTCLNPLVDDDKRAMVLGRLFVIVYRPEELFILILREIAEGFMVHKKI